MPDPLWVMVCHMKVTITLRWTRISPIKISRSAASMFSSHIVALNHSQLIYFHLLGWKIEFTLNHQGYMKLIQDKEVVLPPTLEDKDKIVFGNVHQIYDWHKEYVEIQMLSQANAANHIIPLQMHQRMQPITSFLTNAPKDAANHVIPHKCIIRCSQSIILLQMLYRMQPITYSSLKYIVGSQMIVTNQFSLLFNLRKKYSNEWGTVEKWWLHPMIHSFNFFANI